MRGILTTATVIGIWVLPGSLVVAADVGPTPPAPRAPVPYVAPLYDWTGFYLGGHGGAGWSGTTAQNPGGVAFAPPGASVNIPGSGWLAGGQLGYNQQIGAWVFGIEGDLSYTDIRGTTTSPFGADVTVRTDWLGTV